MRIEDEIKQEKFDSEYQKLAVNIIFTFHWLQSNQFEFLKEFDLTTQQYNVLRILRGQHPNSATVTLIKERMLDKMSDASRLVDRLVNKGLVERRICEKDRRRVDVLITDKGLELLSKIDDTPGMNLNELKSLSENEAAKLNTLLDKLRG
ncbi:MAG: MarR family transcriptional regulator [Ignavibacteria bacterium]|nr:MAG: MarR family transcriptional regulator [Ignavibacteria bacterium]